MQVANTPEKLLTLATYAEQNSVTDIADAAYSEAIKIGADKIGQPMPAGCVLRWLPEKRLKRKRSQRRSLSFGPMTRQPAIRMLICDCCSAHQVMRLKQRNAKLRSSSQRNRGTGKRGQRSAWPVFVSGGKQEALAAIREPRVTGVEPPGALAVRAAILAANGYEDGARNDARLISAKPLLPEERALIAPLLQ